MYHTLNQKNEAVIMKTLSPWATLLIIVALFLAVAATGVYGQLAPMPSGSLLSTVHSVGSVALVALACFHGAYGLRRRLYKS